MGRVDRLLRVLACVVVSGLLTLQAPASANEAAPAVADPALEARVQRLVVELRCLVCQNQTIADSNAELAVDLRRQVREMLQRGSSDAEILAYMTDRYGDFILYRPPLKASTALLWFGPAALLVGGAGALFVILRRRDRLHPAQFEPDLDDPDDKDMAPAGARPASRVS